MACVFQDSFQLYGAGSDDTDLQERGWTVGNPSNVSTVASAGPAGTETVVECTGTGYIEHPATTSGTTAVLLAKFRVSNVAAGFSLLEMRNNSAADLVLRISVTAGRAIELRNSAGTVVATSNTGAFNVGTWHRIGVKVTSIGNTSAVTVQIDGATLTWASGSSSSVDTSISATNVDLVKFYGNNTTDTTRWCHVLLHDGSGSVNTDLVADWTFSILVPTADTATEDFTRSTGADSFALLDDTVPGDHNGDTDYIESSTVAHKTLMDCANLAGGIGTVYTVGVVYSARKTDSGARTMNGIVKNGTTEGDGAVRDPGTSYSTHCDIFNQNPDGPANWTPTTVNSAQVGVEIAA